MPPPPTQTVRWLPFATAALLAAVGHLFAQQKTPAAAQEGDTGLVLMAKSERPEVFAPVKQAKETVLAAAYIWKYGLMRPVTKKAWEEGDQSWEKQMAATVKRADALVESLEPQFKRDARGVIDYALIESDSPWLTTVLLSRQFLPKFQREFGRRLHVVAVDRRRLFVFPADGGKLEGFGQALADQYHDETVTKNPVSLEVFLVDGTGFRAIGSIGE